MNAKFRQNSIHAALADLETVLFHFLGDDLVGRVGIQKAIANHLVDNSGRATVVGLGPALMIDQACGTLLMIKSSQLEIPLWAESEFLGGTVRAVWTAFALDEHGQFVSDLVVGSDG